MRSRVLLIVGGSVAAVVGVAAALGWFASWVDRAREAAGTPVRLTAGLRSELPEGWQRNLSLETGEMPLVAQGPTEADQLIVRVFAERGGAEEAATSTAIGLAAAGKPCSRQGADPVWDCSYDSNQGRILAYYVAKGWPDRSVLVFLQGHGDHPGRFEDRLQGVVSATRW